jgi:hypothetical protein
MPHCIHRRFCHQGDKALLLRMVNKMLCGKILSQRLVAANWKFRLAKKNPGSAAATGVLSYQ